MGKAFSIVERSHAEAKKFFGPRAIDCAVDATIGGGGDALFLASMLSEGGKVFGFDVQEEAVARSLKKTVFWRSARSFAAGTRICWN